MTSFSFKDRVLPLNIEGTTYTVTCDNQLADKFQYYSNKLLKIAEQFKENPDMDDTELINCHKGAVDAALGAGSFDRIFAGRVVNRSDSNDLMVFITAAATEHFKNMKQSTPAPKNGKK